MYQYFHAEWLHKAAYGIIAFSIMFVLSGSFVLAFQCDPPRAVYTLALQTTAKCYSQFRLYQITLYQAVLMFVTDVVILVLPLPVLWNLNMPLRRRVAISMIILSGKEKQRYYS